MHTRIETINGIRIAVIDSNKEILQDGSTALDLAMSIKYEYNICRIVINKKAVAEKFFILSTGLAGEILQKFTNYRIKLAIYGDYSKYTSQPLKDLMYECNNGKDIFFTETEGDAIEKLAAAH